jgi:hypothetical protein
MLLRFRYAVIIQFRNRQDLAIGRNNSNVASEVRLIINDERGRWTAAIRSALQLRHTKESLLLEQCGQSNSQGTTCLAKRGSSGWLHSLSSNRQCHRGRVFYRAAAA